MRLFTALIFAFYANVSLALGLGEATLKSYLGESLIVKLNVTDVEKSPDISCFTISDTNDTPAFKKAFSTLSSLKDGYLLTVTTQSVITEPILSLRVSYHCEPQLHRDYVLLLDPASTQAEIASSNTVTSAVNTSGKQASGKAKASSEVASYTAADANSYAPPARAKRKLKKRQASAASSADDKIMEAYVGRPTAKPTPAVSISEPTAPVKQESVKPDTSSKPYLSISGGSLPADAPGLEHKLSLQFATQIDLDRAPPTTPASSTDLEDEATMMSNRLAHLEKQIISLQTQNALLKDEAAQAKSALAEQQSSWLNYVWMVAVAVLALAALEWLRRTIITRRLMQQEQQWFDADEDTDSEPTLLKTTTQASADYKASKDNPFSDSFLDDDTDDEYTPATPAKSSILAPAEHTSDEHDSIIDNADVFIEHERPLLAIQLLQNHLNDFPAESPKIWLKLLSLLGKEGTEAEYDATVVEANKYFNIKAPSFADANNEDSSSIEEFSNIVARLEGAWGSPFAVKFLNDLIYDQYAQPPEGFSPNNFEELFFLKRIAELLNTGIATNQHTPYQNTASKSAASKPTNESTSPVRSAAENAAFNTAAFNSDAFGDDSAFDNATASVGKSKPKASTISDADFTVAPFPETPQQPVWSRPTQEEMSAQFANSPFQKVPAYEVDMLADFDDHMEVVIPSFNGKPFNSADFASQDTGNHTDLAQKAEVASAPDLSAPDLTLDLTATSLTIAANDTAEELLFPLDYSEDTFPENAFPQDIYPDETAPTEAAASEATANQAEKESTSKKSKDSNLIEWDLPKSHK